MAQAQWKTSANGNSTTLYRGFRATHTMGGTYVYLGDIRVARTYFDNDETNERSFTQWVDDYYEGYKVNSVCQSTFQRTGATPAWLIANGNGSKNYNNGDIIECDGYSVEVIHEAIWYSNSGKTQWRETKCRKLIDGVPVKPTEEVKAVEIDTDTKPGVTGHFQGFSVTPYGIKLDITDKEGTSWSLTMTRKFKGLPSVQRKLVELTKGVLIHTTVSTHTNEWAGEKYFNGFSVIDADDIHVVESGSFDF